MVHNGRTGSCRDSTKLYPSDFAEINKSTAGMQHTLPRDIFNAKKIILKVDLFMQSLKKIGKEMPKIESEKPINNVNQGP